MKKAHRSHIKYLFAITSIMLFSFVLHAQVISSTVDKKDILIGEKITYILSIDLPSPEYNVNITIPDSVAHFEILQKNGGNGTKKDGNSVWQYTIVFTSFDSGTFNFPSLSYRINHLNTASQMLTTDQLKINVGYMPLDKGEQPRDIKTIIEVSFFDWLWVYVAVGILVFIIILFVLIRYLRKNKKIATPPGSITAYQQAMEALDALRKANEHGALAVKEYHTKLADVLRNYYSNTMQQNFLNKTTEEIWVKLKSHELNAETASHAKEALATGDAVKFAKYHPSYTENEAALNYLKTVIEEIELSRNKKD